MSEYDCWLLWFVPDLHVASMMASLSPGSAKEGPVTESQARHGDGAQRSMAQEVQSIKACIQELKEATKAVKELGGDVEPPPSLLDKHQPWTLDDMQLCLSYSITLLKPNAAQWRVHLPVVVKARWYETETIKDLCLHRVVYVL